MKARFMFVNILVLLALVLSACQPAATTEAPAANATATEAAPVEEATATEAAPAAEATATEAAAAPAGEDVCATDTFGCAEIPAGDTIKIGMGAPMTGDNAQFGVDISQGAMLAIADAGEFEGFSFELVAEDDGGTPEGGAAVANKLASDPTVVAVAGHIFSGATDAAMPVYEDKGIPMMSPSATNPDLTKKGSAVFNRVVFTDAAQGKFAAEYLYNKLGFTTIAVMHDGQAYGQGLAQVVYDRFKELGGTVVDDELKAITPGEQDYIAPLSAIASKSPQAVYYGGYVQEAVVLMDNWAQAGLEGVVFFGCDGTFGADFIDKTGEKGEGAYAVALIPPPSPEREAVDAAYLEQFGKEAGSLSPYTWNAYDSAATLVAAIKQVAFVGENGNLMVPRGALVAAVRGMKDFKGLTGTLSCDETGECNSTGPTFYKVQDGKWVVAD